MSNEFVFDASVDQMLENLPIGSVKRALGNNMYGINFRNNNAVLPRSKDTYGFTFFTRPQLNLTTLNITNYRGFYNLLTSVPDSYQRFVRLMLDPRLEKNGKITSPFVDNENAFFSILTNNIVSMSGWPDMSAPIYTSSTGGYGEEQSFVDGVTNHFESYDLDITFRNTKGNPLLYLFYIWIRYETLVFEGILNPYLDMITENEIDYNTRIYRLVTSTDKRFVTHIGSTGASFPVNVPTGNLFDFNTDSPFNMKNSEINIRFRSDGFIVFDDMLKLEFNRAQAIFNPSLAKLLNYDLGDNSLDSRGRTDPTKFYEVPGVDLIKVPHYLLSTTEGDIKNNPFYSINHKCYPFINLLTNELEWWTKRKNITG